MIPEQPSSSSGKRSSFISQLANSVMASLTPTRRSTLFGRRRKDSCSNSTSGAHRHHPQFPGLFSNKKPMPRRRQSSISAAPYMLLIKTTECVASEISPRSVQTKRRTLVSNRVLEKTLRRDTALRRQLEMYAATRYETENVAFMERVLAWKNAGGVDMEEASRICELFIRDGAEMQVNISHDAREHTLHALTAGGAPGTPPNPALFDMAVHEISVMMVNGGVFFSFVFSGKLDGYDERASTGTVAL